MGLADESRCVESDTVDGPSTLAVRTVRAALGELEQLRQFGAQVARGSRWALRPGLSAMDTWAGQATPWSSKAPVDIH